MYFFIVLIMCGYYLYLIPWMLSEANTIINILGVIGIFIPALYFTVKIFNKIKHKIN